MSFSCRIQAFIRQFFSMPFSSLRFVSDLSIFQTFSAGDYSMGVYRKFQGFFLCLEYANFKRLFQALAKPFVMGA